MRNVMTYNVDISEPFAINCGELPSKPDIPIWHKTFTSNYATREKTLHEVRLIPINPINPDEVLRNFGLRALLAIKT